MYNIVIQPKDFTRFNLSKLAKINSNKFNPAVLFRISKVQLLATEDINDRWKLTKISSGAFLRQIDANLTYYPHIEASKKNISLFVQTAADTMDLLATKVIDLKSPTLQSVIIRFDGTIGNKTGSFLIEFPVNPVKEYVDSVRLMKAVDISEKISLNHLLDFYANEIDSPFKNFDLNDFRYIHLPRAQTVNEYSN